MPSPASAGPTEIYRLPYSGIANGKGGDGQDCDVGSGCFRSTVAAARLVLPSRSDETIKQVQERELFGAAV